MRRGHSPGIPAASREPGAAPRRHGCDKGSEAVELVLILSALMMLVTALLQLAMWALASHALSLAVADGGAEARAQPGSGAATASLVRTEASEIGGSLVGSLSVAVTALPDNFVQVSATGTVPAIIPGIVLTVSSASVGPEQDFRGSG